MSTPSLLGSDISGITDVDASLSTVGGRLALAQRVLRRMSTQRGSLIASPLYGFDLQSCIGSMLPVSAINQRVGEQVLLEPEIEDAAVDATFNAKTGELTVDINVVDADGPFDLTLTATELTLSAIADGVVILPKAA
jgi:hypothetical protein